MLTINHISYYLLKEERVVDVSVTTHMTTQMI